MAMAAARDVMAPDALFTRSRLFTPNPAVLTLAEADAELQATLDSLDGAQNYAAWIHSLAEPYLGDEVLEVGAGHGTFTGLLLGSGARVVATDLSARCVAQLRARYAGIPRVEVRQSDMAESADGGPYDSVVLINVLEHLEDDAMADLFAGGVFELGIVDGRRANH